MRLNKNTKKPVHPNTNLQITEKSLSNLWQLENKYYDFTDFMKYHPGGQQWIKQTRGTDITIPFHVHHPTYITKNINTNQALKKYYISDSHHKSLYMNSRENDRLLVELKSIVEKNIGFKNYGPNTNMIIILYVCLIIRWIVFYIVGYVYINYYNVWYLLGLFMIHAIVCMMIIGFGHNFTHQPGNAYDWVTDVVGYPNIGWKIHHCLDHHMYINDPIVENDMLELGRGEFFQLNVKKETNIILNLLHPLIWGFTVFLNQYRCLYQYTNILMIQAYVIPNLLIYYGMNSYSLFQTLLLFHCIIFCEATYFINIATLVHYLEENFSEPTNIKNSHEPWSHRQIRTSVNFHVPFKNNIIIGAMFGFMTNHYIHHLMPGLDACHFYKVEPIIRKLAKKYDLKIIDVSLLDAFLGRFKALHKSKK